MAWSLYGLPMWRQPLPWEMGPAAPLPGLPAFRVRGEVPDVGGASPLRAAPEPAGAVLARPAPAAPGRRASGPPPVVADSADREAALAKWTAILAELASCGAFAKRPSDLALLAKEVLEPKATGTLKSRASALGLYLAWARRAGHPAYPFAEAEVLEYLRECVQAAATRGTAFLEAVAFTGHLFQIPVDEAFSPRARGIACRGLKRKRDVVKREPFPVQLVMAWESLVAAAADAEQLSPERIAKAVFLGFVLWLVHARSRFGDSARLTCEPGLDVAADSSVGYIEAAAKYGQHKTGYQPRKAGRRLPLVGSAFGLSRTGWAKSWLSLRARAGLHAPDDGCLMPEVLADWAFGQSRMSTSAGGMLLRKVLVDGGIQDVGNYGTHSAKATALSWMAKAGVSRSTRRILGGHSDPKDRSMLEYSRDALAGPLQEMIEVFGKIFSEEFDPDSTRSGRWKPTAAAAESASGSAMARPDDEQAEAASSSASSEASEDLHDDEEAEETTPVDIPKKDGVKFLANLKTKALHVAGAAEGEAACGYLFSAATYECFDARPTGGRWHLCRRPNCFKFAQGE